MHCGREVMKLLLLRKEVRSLLKRKNGDAGDGGTFFEDLQATIFSELRSSEGARRMQQRLCGPTVALSFNFLVSVGIIMLNKLVLGKVGFNYPIFLTFLHYLLSWVLMAILNAVFLLPAAPPAKSTLFSSLLALGVVIVGFYQMAKIAVTPTIVLSEFMFLKKTVSFQKALALSIVSIGVAVATVTDLEFQFFGACIALAWIVPSAINKILWSNLQQQDNWTALAATSATSHVVLGQFKTCVILLGGFLLFRSNPGTLSICGAITALAGMSLYTYLSMLVSEQKTTNAALRQSLSFSLSRSKLCKDAKYDCVCQLNKGRSDLVQLLLEFGADVDLRDHPGFAVLESEEVKRVELRARPLDPDAPLKPGKLYFLVDLPRADPEPDHRRAGAGAARSY
ncbi:putative membrane protein [Ananas comosus]|uniref:Putative membrane protein n=1 Tax=Ananas comosus TaxID=4615 RepID=A0A199V2J7_ANACO|nr:putative membrane protein [Ananas comosus]